MQLIDNLNKRVHEVREHRPLVDHIVRTVQHYGKVNGSLQAGAVTYFAFLSFFPILALSFAIIGYVSSVYPDAQRDLVKAIDAVLPGIVGPRDGQVKLDDIEDAAPGIFSIGLVTVLYSGLGWLSGMRTALLTVFEQPERERPNFLSGKLHDMMALGALGVILMVSVGVSTVVTTLSTTILTWWGLGLGLDPVVWVLALLIGIAANTLLFFAFFRLLGDPDAPARALWSGAFVGAIGFELLKQASRYLLALTEDQPAFQAFGIALVLVVWINYFSRVIVYAASWAHTHPAALAAEPVDTEEAVQGPRIDLQQAVEHNPAVAAAAPGMSPTGAFAAGAASMLALVAILRRNKP
ncbi:MAG: hypothetical protein JWN68_2265 [Nocardioides sp.]|jgi:membrane protein|uniref:YihY/virulence factor BrkB family protein n=1 Tax=Nocardioides sp. TaxID=35761 RepID=UPI00260D2322|nr:YhjD/YihY/BrkB family envelope integrity protein [Nocardioides sp.]MCW2834312.1 hypothetical protein [Nocardioides sp.]